MNTDTILFRQVHPSFIQAGRITSQVFEPTPKDEGKLSVYDGDQIDAEGSYLHYTLEHESSGVMGVSHSECTSLDLDVVADPRPFPEHVLIDFSKFGKSGIKKKAKKLKSFALKREWQYQP